jgi:hypothetical protein
MDSEFYPTQAVHLKNDPKTLYTIASWNDSSNSGRIENKQGGRMVTGAEIESAESPESYPVNYWDESNELENED